jgi:hypothetical protein
MMSVFFSILDEQADLAITEEKEEEEAIFCSSRRGRILVTVRMHVLLAVLLVDGRGIREYRYMTIDEKAIENPGVDFDYDKTLGAKIVLVKHVSSWTYRYHRTVGRNNFYPSPRDA